MKKEYYIIRVGKMYVYSVYFMKGLFERVEFTIDKNMAEYYKLPDIRVSELINYISEVFGCDCILEKIEKDI